MVLKNVHMVIRHFRYNKCQVVIPSYDNDVDFELRLDVFPREFQGKLHPGFLVRVDVIIEERQLTITGWRGI
jgi:hypothetical protein